MSRYTIPDDYVNVTDRIKEFKQQYPEGSLQSWRDPYMVGTTESEWIVYSAAAYRTPDDPRPGIGWAWEPVPGPTPFTRNSELMNAETSAWGRAIVALGFETKKIASAEEVRNRSDNDKPTAAESEGMTPGQKSQIKGLLEALEKEMPSELRPQDWTTEAAEWSKVQFSLAPGAELNKAQAQRLIEELEGWLLAEQNARAGAKA